MQESINQKLNNIKIEDFIWVVYLFLAIFAIISNEYEKTSLIRNGTTKNLKSKKINVTIFTITFIIYIYFAYINWRDLHSSYLRNKKQLIENQARLIAALLFIIGGAIYLITEANSETPEVGFI